MCITADSDQDGYTDLVGNGDDGFLERVGSKVAGEIAKEAREQGRRSGPRQQQ